MIPHCQIRFTEGSIADLEEFLVSVRKDNARAIFVTGAPDGKECFARDVMRFVRTVHAARDGMEVSRYLRNLSIR